MVPACEFTQSMTLVKADRRHWIHVIYCVMPATKTVVVNGVRRRFCGHHAERWQMREVG